MRNIKIAGFLILALIGSARAYGQCPTATIDGTTSTCDSSHNFTFDVLFSGSHIPGDYTLSIWTGSWTQVTTSISGQLSTGMITSDQTYQISYELDGGCTDSMEIYVTFNTPPDAPTIHNGVRCGPGGVQVSADQVSGTTYQWYYNSTPLQTDDALWSGGPTVTITGNVLFLNFVSSSFSGLNVRAVSNSSPCGVVVSGESYITVTINPIPTLSIGSDQVVCLGSNLTLSGSPSGGTWTGAGVSSGVFNPSAAGVGPHTVSYSYTNPSTGCDAIASKVLTVAPNISAGPFTACASNYAVELSASPSGGTWSGSMVTSDGIFSANAAGIGTHTITYTGTASGCTSSVNTTVTVTGGSGPSFSYPVDAPTVCGAGAAHLTVDTGGVLPEDIAYFEWFDSNNLLQRDGSGAIVKDRFLTTGTLTQPTSYTVLAVGYNGCATAQSVTANVTDTTPPTIAGASNCSNGTGQVEVSNYSTSFTYNWKDAVGNPITTGASGLISYTITGAANQVLQMSSIPGTSNVTVYVRKGIGNCFSDYSPATVIYRTLPTVTLSTENPAVACLSSASFTLTGGSPSGGSWDIDNNPLSGNSFVPQNYNGTTHQIGYSYTDMYGCTNRAVRPIVIEDPLAVVNQTFTAEYGEPFVVSSRMGVPSPYVLAWYPTSGSTTPLTTGNTYTTPAITGSVKYYLATRRNDVAGCEGTQRAIFTVNAYPANNYNLVREETILNDGVRVDTDITGLPVNAKAMMTGYFDGLGRSMQSVQWSASPAQKDIVQPVEYDLAGREMKKYLPYTSGETSGWYKKSALKNTSYNDSDQRTFYLSPPAGVAGDSSAYAVTVFDNSPMQRVVEQGAPGVAWQPGTNHTIKKQYLTNGSNDVYLFGYNPSTGDVYFVPGAAAYYPLNTLVCNKTIDEQGNDVLEYIDKQGRTICKKVKAPGNTYACTYYIYDDLGNLVVVLPPEGVQRILQTN